MTNILSWPYTYLLILVLSLSGLGLADWRYKLVVFDNPRAALMSITLLSGFFLCWDVVGLWLDTFSTNQAYVSGLYIVSPNLPIEEILFLVLLNYVTLICYQTFRRSGVRHV